MKKSILLGTLLVLILVAMCLPWAIAIPYCDDYNKGIWGFYYWWMTYPLGFLIASPCSSLSTLLALAALPLAFRSTHRRGCSIACGILLVLSAGIQLSMGFSFGFSWFTPLTWAIIAMLAALGLFALLGFRKKAEKLA